MELLLRNTLTPIKISGIVKHKRLTSDKHGEQILWKVLEISNNSVKLSRVSKEVDKAIKAEFNIWCDLSEVEVFK